MATNIKRIKLTIFAEQYWTDEESRPCRATLISHIQRGWLSGKKIGTHWYIECTSWGVPLYYNSETPSRTTRIRLESHIH